MENTTTTRETLAERNARMQASISMTREMPFYGITTEETYVIGAHAGTRRNTGTKNHLARKETVIAVSPETATSPAVLDGRLTFRVGQVLHIEPVCGAAKHATEAEGRDTDSINCDKCLARYVR